MQKLRVFVEDSLLCEGVSFRFWRCFCLCRSGTDYCSTAMFLRAAHTSLRVASICVCSPVADKLY